MKTKIKCNFCPATYPDTTPQMITEGGISICPDCWERLVKEKLTPKEYKSRLKVNK